MKESEIFAAIREVGVVPVIKLERADDARPLGRALLGAGLPLAEVTFRTAAAPEAIRILAEEYPALLPGAGTVLTPAQADAALAAGAAFAVAPGFNPRVVGHCQDRGLPVIPGVNSPSSVEAGLERGLTLLKFFPAEASGGVRMLEALHGPYPEVEFLPTGGVEPANMASYLALPFVAAVGGSWMVSEARLSAGRFDEVTACCAAAVRAVAAARAGRTRSAGTGPPP